MVIYKQFLYKSEYLVDFFENFLIYFDFSVDNRNYFDRIR